MLDRQIARRQWRLCQPDNLKQAKARGVQDVAFRKKCDIAVAEMVKSPLSIVGRATSAPRSKPASSV